MLKYKLKNLNPFGLVFSYWKNANDSSYSEDNKSITLIWDWTAGTRHEELPFKNIPKTIKDIWRVKKNYSLISKIKTTYSMCIEPLLRREVHWTTEFGSAFGGKFFTFDWLTLKIKYKNSSWVGDTFQEKKYYERYLWEKEFRNYKTEFFKHSIGDVVEMEEWDFYEACDHYTDECHKDWEAYCD